MTEKQHIIIKGVKEGLVFLLDDQCAFDDLLEELTYKLQKTHQQLLTGPLVHVNVRLGSRQSSEAEKEQIRAIIRSQGNLMLQSIESDPPEGSGASTAQQPHVLTAIVRSGQIIQYEGDLLLIGDVNPGGSVLCTGNIFIMGALRGVAHAGLNGREDAVIAASLMRPTQLRIAEVISRPPEEWMSEDAAMEFAFLTEGQMQIDKLSQLHRIRHHSIMFK